MPQTEQEREFEAALDAMIEAAKEWRETYEWGLGDDLEAAQAKLTSAKAAAYSLFHKALRTTYPTGQP